MHLDDIECAGTVRVEQYLSKLKVIRRVARKIITFLAQLEDFQKKLWLKKKFVVETSWCIRVGCIPDEFLPEIAANDAQRAEWVDLCRVDTIESDLAAAGYTNPSHRSSSGNTRRSWWTPGIFPTASSILLLATFDDLDGMTDGVLVHSENFQGSELDEGAVSRARRVHLRRPAVQYE